MTSPVVVIPIHRLPLHPDEQVSLTVARKTLKSYCRIFVAPADFPVPDSFLEGERVVRFPRRFFSYPYGYNRLLMSSRFFSAFENFSHVLIYQLDCLVFRDELNDWCSRNYDYVGSPWLDNHGHEGTDPTWKVGNGGFSLRRVSTALGILRKRIKRGSLFPVPPVHLPKPDFWGWLSTNVRKRIKQHLNLWTVEDELENYGDNEDRFWALDVLQVTTEYTKPPVDEALRFGFESHLPLCLEKSHGEMPFGCHAWWKHDRHFWEMALDALK